MVSRVGQTCLLAVLCCCAAPAWAEGSAAATPQHRLRRATSYTQQGFRALRQGDLPRSTQLFEKALALEPMFADAHMGLGHIAMGQARYEDALRDFEGAREAYEKIGDTLLELREQRYFDSQMLVLERQDEIRWLKNPMSGVSGDSALLRIKDLEREIDALDSVERARPDPGGGAPPEVFFHLGNALFHLHRTDEAVSNWERCARSAPRFGPVQVNLAVGYLQLGRLDVARAAASKAMELGFRVHPDIEQKLAAGVP